MDILQGSNTGKNLADSIISVLDNFEITDKILAVTCDNASNMDIMLLELEKNLAHRGISFSAKDQQIRCLAHIVNLACQDALSVLKQAKPVGVEQLNACSQDENDPDEKIPTSKELSIYWRLKAAVIKIRKSTSLNESPKHFCDSMGLPNVQLINDMKVRWNSTFLMLQRCVAVRKALDATMRVDKSLGGLALNDEEWEVVEEMLRFLEPFYRMTNKMSEQFIPSMSLTAVVYMALYNHLESYKPGASVEPYLLDAAEKACEKLNKYYPSSDALVYLVGIVLDPRCKFEWHKFNGFSNLVPQFKRIVAARWKSYIPQNMQTCVEPPADDLYESQMKKPKIDSKDELERYSSTPRVVSSSLTNGVLEWWQDNEKNYSDLFKMARDFLGASATGVPVECLFATGTDLLTVKRMGMLDVTIKICLCLRAWLKFEGKYEMLKSRVNAVVSKMLGDLDE